MNVCDNYWPAPLESIAAENPMETRNVVVAEISTPWGPNSYRRLYTALDLNSLIVEGLNESNLRNLLSTIGVSADLTKGRRGLKLLDVLVQYGIISCESGLRIASDSTEIQTRLREKRASKGAQHLETPIAVLFSLYDLRLVASHSGPDIAEPLRNLGIDPASVEAGWGAALDKLYDAIGDALERTRELLDKAVGAA